MAYITFKPLDVPEWPDQPSKYRSRGLFKATYEQTRELLVAELDRIDAKDITLSLQLTRHQIRRDGWPYNDARPAFPGVIVSFLRDGKPQQVYTDQFCHWQDNLRGIALTLEALRAITRYGCAHRRLA